MVVAFTLPLAQIRIARLSCTRRSIAVSPSERRHLSETARHVPERLIRSLRYIIQAVRMDVFPLEGNSAKKTVSKRITSGIERDTSFRSDRGVIPRLCGRADQGKDYRTR